MIIIVIIAIKNSIASMIAISAVIIITSKKLRFQRHRRHDMSQLHHADGKDDNSERHDHHHHQQFLAHRFSTNLVDRIYVATRIAAVVVIVSAVVISIPTTAFTATNVSGFVALPLRNGIAN